jgi:hypothetical protein
MVTGYALVEFELENGKKFLHEMEYKVKESNLNRSEQDLKGCLLNELKIEVKVAINSTLFFDSEIGDKIRSIRADKIMSIEILDLDHDKTF